MAELYKHGIYTSTTDTQMPATDNTEVGQVVIGTAPVYLLDDPQSAVNVPIVCRNISDCRKKLGYRSKFGGYTLCQSMYANFMWFKVAPVVYINVLDPSKHKEAVAEKEFQINNNIVTIEDDVIVSSLQIKKNDELSTVIDKDKYVTAWVDGVLYINFTEEQTGTVKIAYDKADPSKVTDADILGAWSSGDDKRTGAELIKSIFPMLGIVPFIITAPGWSHKDNIGSILAAKAAEINGCYKAMFIADIDSATAKTKAKAIETKEKRTLDENCIATYPMVVKDGYTFYLSAVVAALIMYQATQTDGITCKSPSNQKIAADDVVLADGTSVFYDQEDGNDLNGAGLVTVISRNGLYVWGNNTAIYPDNNDPVKRWIMTRLTFLWIENDFINSNFHEVDGALSKKMIENIITNYNIKLSSYAAAGYIADGQIYYDEGDNPDEEILNGHFTFRTRLAANVPGEFIENIFSFDIDALRNSILGTGGEENE